MLNECFYTDGIQRPTNYGIQNINQLRTLVTRTGMQEKESNDIHTNLLIENPFWLFTLSSHSTFEHATICFRFQNIKHDQISGIFFHQHKTTCNIHTYMPPQLNSPAGRLSFPRRTNFYRTK